MKIKDVDRINELLEQRDDLAAAVKNVCNLQIAVPGIGTASGELYGAVKEAAQPAVQRELERRLVEVENDLRDLGVDLGDGPPAVTGMPE